MELAYKFNIAKETFLNKVTSGTIGKGYENYYSPAPTKEEEYRAFNEAVEKKVRKCEISDSDEKEINTILTVLFSTEGLNKDEINQFKTAVTGSVEDQKFDNLPKKIKGKIYDITNILKLDKKYSYKIWECILDGYQNHNSRDKNDDYDFMSALKATVNEIVFGIVKDHVIPSELSIKHVECDMYAITDAMSELGLNGHKSLDDMLSYEKFEDVPKEAHEAILDIMNILKIANNKKDDLVKYLSYLGVFEAKYLYDDYSFASICGHIVQRVGMSNNGNEKKSENKTDKESTQNTDKKSEKKSEKQDQTNNAQNQKRDKKSENAKDNVQQTPKAEANSDSNIFAKGNADNSTLDFSAFGIKIDTDAMDGNQSVQQRVANPQSVPHMNVVQPPNFNPNPNPIFQQPKGNHKCDEPKKPPKPKKADEDKIDVDLSNMEKINIEPPAPSKRWPDVVSNDIGSAEPAEDTFKPMIDNSKMIEKYPILEDIEKAAHECKVNVYFEEQIGFDQSPIGMIRCFTYTTNLKTPTPFKEFTIDLGNIIDGRTKVFPGIMDYGFEYVKAYPYSISVRGEKRSEKPRNEFNKKLFVDIFTGGVDMLQNHKALYNDNFMKLNQIVDLSTTPPKMSTDTKRAIRDRLLNAVEVGLFDKIYDNLVKGYNNQPNRLPKPQVQRFKFTSFDDKLKTFNLTSKGVQPAFNVPTNDLNEVNIFFKLDNKTDVKYNPSL